MNIMQTRLEVQYTIQDWILDLMQSNKIPAYIIEDALNRILIDIKDQSNKEFLVSLQPKKEEKEEEQNGS